MNPKQVGGNQEQAHDIHDAGMHIAGDDTLADVSAAP